MLNLYDILTEQIITEARDSKIYDKLRKIIKRCNPNVSTEVWNEEIPTANGGTQRKIESEAHKFVHSFFNNKEKHPHILELIPHTAEIAYGELDYYANPNSQDIKDFREIMGMIIDQFIENEDKFDVGFEKFKTCDYNEIYRIYGWQIEQKREEEREEAENVVSDGSLNGYTVHAIDTYEQSQEFKKYTYENSRWCLTYLPEYYFGDYYTDNCQNRVYFITHEGFENIEPNRGEKPSWKVPEYGDSPYDAYGYSMISIIVNPDGDIVNCCSRWNHAYGNADDFLSEDNVTRLLQEGYRNVLVPYTEEELEEREDYSDENNYGEDEEDHWDRIYEYVERAIARKRIPLGKGGESWRLEISIHDRGDIITNNWDATSEDEIEFPHDVEYAITDYYGRSLSCMSRERFYSNSVIETFGVTYTLGVILEETCGDKFFIVSENNNTMHEPHVYEIATYYNFNNTALIITKDGNVVYFPHQSPLKGEYLYGSDGEVDLGGVDGDDVELRQLTSEIGPSFFQIYFSSSMDRNDMLFRVNGNELELIIEDDMPAKDVLFTLSEDGYVHCENNNYPIDAFTAKYVIVKRFQNNKNLCLLEDDSHKVYLYDNDENIIALNQGFDIVEELDYWYFQVWIDCQTNIVVYDPDKGDNSFRFLFENFCNSINPYLEGSYFILDYPEDNNPDSNRYMIANRSGEIYPLRFYGYRRIPLYDVNHIIISINGKLYDNVFSMPKKQLMLPQENTAVIVDVNYEYKNQNVYTVAYKEDGLILKRDLYNTYFQKVATLIDEKGKQTIVQPTTESVNNKFWHILNKLNEIKARDNKQTKLLI